jgi:hypothetical protein
MAVIEREDGATAAGREADGSVDKAAWVMRRARRTAPAEEERRAAAIAGVGTRRRLWRDQRDDRSLLCNRVSP